MRTPYLMAPETLRGEPYDEKIDVYFFGIILYEIVSPQDATNFVMMRKVCSVNTHSVIILCHSHNRNRVLMKLLGLSIFLVQEGSSLWRIVVARYACSNSHDSVMK